jgi:hypothetical protein
MRSLIILVHLNFGFEALHPRHDRLSFPQVTVESVAEFPELTRFQSDMARNPAFDPGAKVMLAVRLKTQDAVL